MQKLDDLISKETMSGWPIFKMNLKEILIKFGAIDDGQFLKFNIDNPILKLYPTRLTDDGMGYGVGQEYIVDVDCIGNRINIWTEEELDKKSLEELKTLYKDLI